MADTDAIIRRQIWLLQFANGFGERIIDEYKPSDQQLRTYLRDWLDYANDNDLSALLRADRRNQEVRDLYRQLRSLRDDQLKRIETFVVTELEALIVSEGRALSKALDGTYKPRPAEVLNQPILGVKPRDQVKADVRWWYDMTLAQVVDAVQSDANAVQTIFGSRGQPSGSLMNSRNLRIERNAETQIVGVAANTRRVVYVSAKIEQEEYLATLDHRSCLSCINAEIGSPYKIGEGPHPTLHPRCLPGDSLVSTSHRVSAVSKRWFDGDMIVIRTASGKRLVCTPNHPVLTRRGFLPASAIDVGDDTVNQVIVDGVIGGQADHKHIETPIEKLADSFRRSRSVMSTEVPMTAPAFHGDGIDGEICTIWADRSLLGERNAAFMQHFGHPDFVSAGNAASSLSSYGLSAFRFVGNSSAARSIMSAFNLGCALCGSHAGPLNGLSFGLGSNMGAMHLQLPSYDVPRNAEFLSDGIFRQAGFVERDGGFDIECARLRKSDNFNTSVNKPVSDDFSGYAELASKLINGHSGPVTIDNIINIDVVRYSGHVYNLETETGWYLANGIINHNCRCLRIPYLEEQPTPRPFVEDDRSVRNIPVNERARKIGRTTSRYDEFFERQTEAAKRRILGPARYELYRNGAEITDFVNDRTLKITSIDDLDNAA